MPKTKQQNFPTKLFIAASLATFVLFALLLFFIKINLASNAKNDAGQQAGSNDKYYLNENYEENDPFITKIPSLKDMLTGPIISQRDPMLGNNSAQIAIVEFSDYECGFCQKQEQALKQIIDQYDGKVKLIWKDFPEKDENSISFQAAVSARCAQKQNQFWAYHDLLYENSNNLSKEKFLELANNLNLNLDKFNDCLTSESAKNLVQDNIKEANALDINGIPFIYINDQEVMGEINFEVLKIIVEIELNK